MKIAMIDPSLFTWPYDKALINGLKAQGHKVDFYTRFLSNKDQGRGEADIKEFFYPCFQFEFIKNLPSPLFLGLKGVAHIFCMAVLLFKLKTEKPDIIHFQWVPLPVVDQFFIPFFKKIAPVVLTVHDSSPFNNNPKSKLQGMGAIKIMALFDHLIVHTLAARKKVEGYGINSNKISHIAHGVIGIENIHTNLQKIEKTKDDKIVILLFGHLKPYKGADVLIKAISHMGDEARSKAIIKIAGKPQMDVEPLFVMANTLGVEKNIQWDLRFIGDDEIQDMFDSSDITVMPYREIDASGVLMVALAIGKPIVASNIGLFAEILVDGEHGFLVPQESPKDLSMALEKLILNHDMRKTMGMNVIALGKSIPTWDEIAIKTGDMYQCLKS